MAQQPDLPGPTTSYSDPFYDRLEALAQRIAKRLWLVLLALVVVVVVAVITHAATRDTPIAASAGLFIDAATKRMEADRIRDPGERTTKLAEAEKAFVAVSADETVTPYYRARACLEAAQLELDRAAITEAKASVAKAKTFATKALDPDLDLAIGLSEAAVLFQAGEHTAAETSYLNVERAAGLTHPDRQIAATIGAAQAMVALNRIDDAIAKLEVLANRNDNNAATIMLLSVAKKEYWTLKRRQSAPAAKPAATPETPAAPASTAPAPAAPTAAAPAAPAETTPTAPPAPAPVVPAATPVAPAPAPVVPAPAPSPEGK